MIIDKFELVENQGYFYLIHKASNKTYAHRYVNREQAIDMALKLQVSWKFDAGVEVLELRGRYFLKGEETCRTVGVNLRYID